MDRSHSTSHDLFANIEQDTKDAFKAYHHERPEVWELFVQYARQMRGTGKRRYSAKSIFERIRWECDLNSASDSFKLNNDFTALYARMLMKAYPEEFGTFFELREAKGLIRVRRAA